MRSLRVLFLVENNPYPRDFRVRREAGTLRDAGCRVSVIAPREGRQPWTETLDGILVYRFPAPPSGTGLLGYAFEFLYATCAILALSIWVAVRRGVDIIHAANPPDTLFVVGAAARLFGIKYVFDQHDLAPETYLARFTVARTDVVHWALRLLERASYATAHAVVSPNHSYRRVALTRGGKAENRVFVVRNGPPLAFLPVEPDPEIVRCARHLIGYVGTIGPQDGLDYWVRALREIVVRHGRRDVLAIVIGDGDDLERVKALARSLGVEAYLWFTGRLPEGDVRRHLSAVHVCVQPDPSSPLNDRSTMNKLMEYMALGKPTVAFDLAETRYSAGDAALYARPNDVAEFARQVCRLLDDPAERRALGEAGQRRVRDGLTWEHSAAELLRCYREGVGVSASDRLGLLTRAFAKARHYYAALGLRGVFQLMRARISGTTPLCRVTVAGLLHPVFVRAGTTDVSVLRQVLHECQYATPLPSTPRRIIDAGANIGLAAVFFADRYPASSIVAIEPDASNFAVLVENTRRYPNVLPVRGALWSRDGVVTIVDPGRGHHGFRTSEPETAGADETVPAWSMTSLMRRMNWDRVDLLKVDIEGAEREVFTGCEPWIGSVGACMIELHDAIQPGCTEAFDRATGAFTGRTTRGESIVVWRERDRDAEGPGTRRACNSARATFTRSLVEPVTNL